MISLINDSISKEDIEKLIEWLKTFPRLTKGPITKEFEEKWAKWLGTRYAVFVNSGSSANLLMLYALIAADKLKNNKIVVPSLAWATDLAPVLQFNLHPILCDINPDTLGVDLNELEKIFKEEKPSVLMLVSILGFAPDTPRIKELCDKYDVILLEDNCESLGTKIDGIKLGNFGLMSSYSTYYGHHISTIEGGMICTNDKEMYNILMSIRSHGWDRDMEPDVQKELREKYNIDEFNVLYTFYYDGFNVRSTDLQAFIGLQQLDKLDSIIEKRHDNFNYFQEHIHNVMWKTIPLENSYTSSFCYPIIHLRKNKLINLFKAHDVEIRPLVCGSMGNQPFYYKRYGIKKMKICDLVSKYGFYIPNHPSLTKNDMDKMINIINNVENYTE